MATIYVFATQKHFELVGFISSFLAVILMSSVIGGILMLLSKSKNFGKFLGITTVILSVISFLGNRHSEKLIEEVEAQKEESINHITSNFKSAYTEFNNKLNADDRKDILNQLIMSNEITFGDSKTTIAKIDTVDEYYEWIDKMNDSLISDVTNQFNKYQEKSTVSEREKTEIQKAIFDLELMKTNTSINRVNTGSIIFAMRNLLSIKNNCKHELKNGKILFFDTKCLEDWNKAELQLNEYIQNSNKSRESLLN